jgi:hypothetical protein
LSNGERGEKELPLRISRLRHLAVAVTGLSIAALIALSNVAVALAGGSGTSFP